MKRERFSRPQETVERREIVLAIVIPQEKRNTYITTLRRKSEYYIGRNLHRGLTKQVYGDFFDLTTDFIFTNKVFAYNSLMMVGITNTALFVIMM